MPRGDKHEEGIIKDIDNIEQTDVNAQTFSLRFQGKASDISKEYTTLIDRLRKYHKTPIDTDRPVLAQAIKEFYKRNYYHGALQEFHRNELNSLVLQFDIKNPLIKDDFIAALTSLTTQPDKEETLQTVRDFYAEKYDELKKPEQDILNRYALISDFDIANYNSDRASWKPKGLNASRLFRVFSNVSEEDRNDLYRNCEKYLTSKAEQIQFYLLSERFPSDERIQHDAEQFAQQRENRLIEHSYSAERLSSIFAKLSTDDQEFLFTNVDKFLLENAHAPLSQKLKFYDLALTYFINLHDPEKIEKNAQNCFTTLKYLIKQPEHIGLTIDSITLKDLEEFYRKYYPHLPTQSKIDCNNLIAEKYSQTNPKICETLFTIAKNEKLQDTNTKRSWLDSWNAMSTRMKALTILGVFLGLAVIAAAILFPISVIAPAVMTAGGLMAGISGTTLAVNLASSNTEVPYKNNLKIPNQDELIFPSKAERLPTSAKDQAPPHNSPLPSTTYGRVLSKTLSTDSNQSPRERVASASGMTVESQPATPERSPKTTPTANNDTAKSKQAVSDTEATNSPRIK